MEYPYFPLYVQDFLLGTMDMTSEELGGYVRLLLHQWDKGSVPIDDKEIARISKVKPKNTAAIVKKFIQQPDATMKNARLEKVRTELGKKYAKLQENGAKGGRPAKPKGLPKDNQKVIEFIPNGSETETKAKPEGGETQNQIQNQNQTTPRVLGGPPELSPIREAHCPTWQSVEEIFMRLGRPDQARGFFEYYEGLGWKKGISPILSVSSFANRWVASADPEKPAAGRKVIMEHNGGEVEWTEQQYLQYCNNKAASGYTFIRYEL